MASIFTKALFFETCPTIETREKFKPKWTLKEKDHTYQGVTYISMKKVFIEMEDVSEYEFAMSVLGSYPHWEHLTTRDWFKPHLEQWRKELNLKLKARAMKAIIKSATTEENLSFQAMKYLADNQYIDKDKKRGRPSKEELKAELQKELESSKTFKDDAERIGLKLVK